MKLSLYDLKGNKVGDLDLPAQFNEFVRKDLIKRAFLAIRSHSRQAYGTDPRAGMKSSAKLSRKRKDYKGAYGHGISRVPRKILIKRGSRLHWVGAFAPGTVGGRKAHGPVSEKIWFEKINSKERIKAIRSAISATIDNKFVSLRHRFIPKSYPLAVSDDFLSLEKTKDVLTSLQKLGFENELNRTSILKIRSGKGKARGRKYRKKRGLLIVVPKEDKLSFSAKNIPGIDIVEVSKLNALFLAPGGVPGRLTLWTEGAIKTLKDTKLFI